MAKYSPRSAIVVAALCLAGILCPLISSAPTSAPTSSTAAAFSDTVAAQTGNKQIAVDNELCLETGKRVLAVKGNNAVDAAVATLLCLGVVNFQSSGMGGGMVMVVAEKVPGRTEPNVTVIDARVVAPQSVSDTSPSTLTYQNDKTLALMGPSSIAVPGELRGMKLALEWFSKDSREKRAALFKDAISYAQNGFQPSEHLLNAIQCAVLANSNGHSFFNQQSALWFQGLKSLLQDNEGEYLGSNATNVTRPQLAATLNRLVTNGFDDFYTGTVANNLVADINSVCSSRPNYCRKLNSIISTQDLRNYAVVTRNPFKFSYGTSYDVYTTPAPYGGPALAIFLGIVTGKVTSSAVEHDVYHYITEAAKFAASYRMKLGDPAFNSAADVTPATVETDVQDILNDLVDDEARPPTDLVYYRFQDGQPADGLGTTHLSVVTPNMSVSVTSSVNDFFGSGFLSQSTGVLLNNDMDGFAFDDRFPFNQIAAGKRPLSATCPTIVVDTNGDFKLVTGAAGGTRIPPAVGQTMFYALTKDTTAKQASCKPRVYADLDKSGMSIFQQVEKSETSGIPGVGFPSNGEILIWLEEDHNQSAYGDYSARSVVQSILNTGGNLDAHSDVRKFGGDCSWGFSTHVKLLLIISSIALQYICIYM